MNMFDNRLIERHPLRRSYQVIGKRNDDMSRNVKKKEKKTDGIIKENQPQTG